MTFAFADPTQLWLTISEAHRTAAQTDSQTAATPGDRWTVYLNQLCLHAFLTGLQEADRPHAAPWLSWAETSRLSSLVSGVAIASGQHRFVLIPSEGIAEDELQVPQEWVDLPDWAADYYLAAQVSDDQQWVKIWGYTTHQRLKAQATYDAFDRTYCLGATDLIADLNVLWTAQALCPDETTRAAVSSPPVLAQAQAEALIQRLTRPGVAFPRLAVPFAQWGALLANPAWRQQLYQTSAGANAASAATPLNQWFQNLVTGGWQSLEGLFGTEAERLAFGLRRDRNDTEIRQAKLIRLGPDGPTVRLVLFLQPETDGRIGVRVQLYPANTDACLPPHITLALLSASGAVQTAVTARRQDNYIQLPRFKCPADYRFGLQIQLNSASVTEFFTT